MRSSAANTNVPPLFPFSTVTRRCIHRGRQHNQQKNAQNKEPDADSNFSSWSKGFLDSGVDCPNILDRISRQRGRVQSGNSGGRREVGLSVMTQWPENTIQRAEPPRLSVRLKGLRIKPKCGENCTAWLLLRAGELRPAVRRPMQAFSSCAVQTNEILRKRHYAKVKLRRTFTEGLNCQTTDSRTAGFPCFFPRAVLGCVDESRAPRVAPPLLSDNL